MIKLFTKKPVWAVVFAAAAIFAVTFVSCGGDDSSPGYQPKSENLPVNYATSELIASLFEGGEDYEARDIVYIKNKDAEGPDVDYVDIDVDLVIPAYKTLDLDGHKLTVAASANLVVLGTLKGLVEPTAPETAKQLTVSGKIITTKADDTDATKEGIAKYANTATNVVLGVTDKANIKASGVAGGPTRYFLADYTGNVADLKAVEFVSGFVSITEAATSTTTNVSLADLKTVKGALTLAGPADGDNTLAFTVGSVKVGGAVSVTGKATLTATALMATTLTATTLTATVLTVDNLTLGANGTATVTGIYTIATGVTVTGGVITADASGATIKVDSGKLDVAHIASISAGLAVPATVKIVSGTDWTLEGAAVTGGSYATATGLAGTIAIGAEGKATHSAADIFTTGAGSSFTVGSIKIEDGKATVGGATSAVVKTLTVKKTLALLASTVITVPATDGEIIVAAGGVIDLDEGSIKLTGGATPAQIVLQSAVGNDALATGGGKILLDSSATGKTPGALGSVQGGDKTTAAGNGANLFQFAKASSSTAWDSGNGAMLVENSAGVILLLEAGTRATGHSGTPGYGQVILTGGASSTDPVLSKASKFSTVD